MNKIWIVMSMSLFLVACGGGEKKPGGGGASPEAAPEPAVEAAAEAAAPAGTAVIRGVVKFTGTAPKRRKLEMGADAFCKTKMDEQALDEFEIVNANGTLRNVFVHAKTGVKGKYPPPATPVVIDQQGCRYHPHVSGVMVGQKLLIRNSDPILHNVNIMSKKGQGANIAQAKQGMETEQLFRREEVMVEFKCDVHGWMGCFLGVVKHPFFSVTGEDGSFEIRGLPAGEYTIEAWHEVYGPQAQTVTVADGETKTIEYTFSK